MGERGIGTPEHVVIVFRVGKQKREIPRERRFLWVVSDWLLKMWSSLLLNEGADLFGE